MSQDTTKKSFFYVGVLSSPRNLVRTGGSEANARSADPVRNPRRPVLLVEQGCHEQHASSDPFRDPTGVRLDAKCLTWFVIRLCEYLAWVFG